MTRLGEHTDMVVYKNQKERVSKLALFVTLLFGDLSASWKTFFQGAVEHFFLFFSGRLV